MKTPGVYIVEKSAFPNSVVEVATAVPAFIGYTEKADNKGRSLANHPWRITSLAEYHSYFGGAPEAMFTIADASAGDPTTGSLPVPASEVTTDAAPQEAGFTFGGKSYNMTQDSGNYLLYNSMRLFFQNGGGPCYIVSVGKYGDDVESDKLMAGIDLLIKEQEPTMVVIPDVVLLDEANCISVQQAMLAHCGEKMKNRFAILDVWGGYKDRQDPSGDCIDNFRNALGINFLDYSAAYYPWVNATIVQDSELSYENITNKTVLQSLLSQELSGLQGKAKAQADAEIAKLSSPPSDPVEAMMLNKSLSAISPVLYGSIMREIKDKLNLLPPAAAMAGVYTMVDNARGVWKAPANVSLSAVVSPAVNITHDDQEDLNVTAMGKSINAIRPFIGEGVLVWGGRTLDGNSLDWRYIQVRRTILMLEESIKLAGKAYVFENNTANTWVTIKSMINNFLTGIWKRGGLAGASPGDAFNVFVGLGETMTPDDILEGILRVTVLVALIRPAEFIEITFQQQQQQS
jgi:hypothetical protein